ncbi:hypothetical protein FBUS_02042 [Fasciolopsis buskii]|uniref:C2H2-type domain-containing protein n=1 Tax=Fasciolopsis buskii TaxID=27845 RepID=A0A8E0RK45_9TREM|nr:hypothetical protein FBUS_02042 [Fasciolopsis buski]
MKPESKVKLLQQHGLPSLSSLKLNGSTLHGSASEIFQLLLAIEVASHSQPTDETALSINCFGTMPSTELLSPCAVEDPPLYVTVYRKDKTQARKTRFKPRPVLRGSRKLPTPSKFHNCPKCSAFFSRHFALAEHIRMVSQSRMSFTVELIVRFLVVSGTGSSMST